MTLRKGDDLEGKVALVTGAGKNIGRAVARSLAAGGASVMVHANTSREAAEETVALIEKDGGRADCYLADVTRLDEVNEMVGETVARFGRLDFLINNHALRGHTPIQDLSYEDWRKVVAVTLDGTFLCCKAAVPYLIESGGGAIVTFGGQGALQGQRGGTHASAAKWGVVGLTKALALDLAPFGISVNCVAPALINTVGADGQVRHESARTPLGRIGRVEEVAALVRMLCGPEVRYITGQTLHINGGGLMP
jgi:3-oxoacyl-[acyl-carrier protein] reductase